MLDSLSVAQQNRKKKRSGSQSSTPSLKYLEINLADDERNTFYAGFTQDVAGIFVSTYASCPIGTATALLLNFPNGKQKSLLGTVEWIREFNPTALDMEPGIGIRFVKLESSVQELIEEHIQKFPPLFFDDSRNFNEKFLFADHTEKNAPKSILHADDADLRKDYEGISGLVRDVLAYLDQEEAIELHVPRSQSKFLSVEQISVTAVADLGVYRQFHGGFSKDDFGSKVFVATETYRPIGTSMHIHIALPDGWTLRARGEVKWARKYNPAMPRHIAPPGLGISLQEVSEEMWQTALDLTCARSKVLVCEETTSFRGEA